MERCGFFDANLVGEEYDRVYLASQFAAYFASFIGNGVFGGKSDELQVMAASNPAMQIVVFGGQGWINGYWYENTSNLTLMVDVADGSLNRIDSVVLRIGYSERTMWLAIKKGTPATSPKAPTVTRNADYYELQLATINIPAGCIKITQSQINDTRLDTTVCGWVTGLVKQADTSTLYLQIQTALKEFEVEQEADFLAWYNGVKDFLTEDVAITLENQINVLSGKQNALETAMGGWSFYPNELTQAQYDALSTDIKNTPKMLFVIKKE